MSITTPQFMNLLTAEAPAVPLLLRETPGERAAQRDAEELPLLRASLVRSEDALRKLALSHAQQAEELDRVRRLLTNERAAHVRTMERMIR